MDRHIRIFQVNSGDFSTLPNDNANSFSNQLPNTIILEKDKFFEVCLYDIMFQNDQDIEPSPTSGPLRNVCVNTDLVESVQNGSETNNTIYTINWTSIARNSVPIAYDSYGANSSCFVTTYGCRQWVPLRSNVIFRIKVYLTFDDDGKNINTNPDPTAFTSCTFAIREIL